MEDPASFAIRKKDREKEKRQGTSGLVYTKCPVHYVIVFPATRFPRPPVIDSKSVKDAGTDVPASEREIHPVVVLLVVASTIATATGRATPRERFLRVSSKLGGRMVSTRKTGTNYHKCDDVRRKKVCGKKKRQVYHIR